ncbi:MAG: hypothetical protein NTW64_02450 [Candidatus Omnitrophica bacterium]|nr:hypothetical protein [Candidatus Omnitrophota bacterium]
MFKIRQNQKGVMLFIVLGMLLIVAIIIGGILGFISSSLRKTYHQVRRIRGYYAALAGINCTIYKIRKGEWAAAGSYKICSRWQNGATQTPWPDCNFTDYDLPFNVSISVSNADGAGIRTISATVEYTTPD